LAIVDAILAGERDPHKLAQLRDWRIRASEETIVKSLVGDYRQEHLFTLRQSLESYRHYQDQIHKVDARVKRMMQTVLSKVAEGGKPPKEKNPRKTPWRNEPPQLRDDLYRAFGVDLTQIPGINTLTVQMIFTEIGPDFSRFPTAAAFCSWPRLCPDPKISGGQVLSNRTRPTKNRAALALRMGAQEGSGWRGGLPTRTRLLTNVRGGEKPGNDTPHPGGLHNRPLPSEIILFLRQL
jgi:transposase